MTADIAAELEQRLRKPRLPAGRHPRDARGFRM
jgi:hypothetical protein